MISMKQEGRGQVIADKRLTQPLRIGYILVRTSKAQDGGRFHIQKTSSLITCALEYVS